MMDQNFMSTCSFVPYEYEAADPSKDQIDHKRQYKQRPPSPPKMTSFLRHTSSSSVVSSRSFLSNASSTRTHRRSVVEVSSILFEGSSPATTRSNSERTTERTDTYMKPRAIKPSRQASYDTYEVYSHSSEMRGPEALSRSSSSYARVSSDDILSSTSNNIPTKQQSFFPASHDEEDDINIVDKDPTLRAVELIRELSFEPPTTASSCGSKTPLSSVGRSFSSRSKNASSSSVKRESASSSTHHSWLSNEMPSFNSRYEYDAPSFSKPTVNAEVRDYGVPPPAPPSISPPLPPRINRLGSDGLDSFSAVEEMPQQIMHNRNRARSTSISEMSESYLMMGLDDDNSSSDSTRSSKSIDEEANERKSVITTIDMPQSPSLAPRPVSLFTSNRGRSLSVASGQSSYVSSSSSSSDDMSFESSDFSSYEEDMEEHQEYVEELKGLGDHLPNQDSGALSLQDGKCNAVNSSIDAGDHNVCQLTADNLMEWNIICEEELAKGRGIVARPQFVTRATSCPNKIISDEPVRGGSFIMEQDEVESVEEPHLLASPLALNGAISPSLFSYTNSGRSTISSEDPEELNSELAFDIDFIHSYSLDKSSVSAGNPLDGKDRLNRCHRRCRSSASRLGKPCLPKEVLLNQEGGQTKTCRANRQHRRFKSDGILSSRLGVPNPVLSQINFSFTEAPSFKSKYSALHRRGKSLDSLTGFFDCSPLQCIVEEASKSSNSDDDFPVLSMVDCLKQYLESMTPIRVLELGFILGLFIGLLIPLLLSAY